MPKNTTSYSAKTSPQNRSAPNSFNTASQGTAQQRQMPSDSRAVLPIGGTRILADGSLRSFVIGYGQINFPDAAWAPTTVVITQYRNGSVAGNSHTGQFTNWYGDGNSLFGTYEAETTAAVQGPVAGAGTWYLRGGTGKFANVVGCGTFRFTVTPDAKVEVTWTGDFVSQEPEVLADYRQQKTVAALALVVGK